MNDTKKSTQIEVNQRLEAVFDDFRVRFEYNRGAIELEAIQINTNDVIEEQRLTMLVTIMDDFKLLKIKIKRSGKGLKIELFKNNENE